MPPPQFLELLTYIIGTFDPYGNSHSERVTHMALALAKRAGVEDGSQEMEDIKLAGLLHDIGKIGIPESIRRMPGRYTLPERMIMETHPVIGMEFLMKVPNGGLSKEMKLIVRHHHEDWSGHGYPDQLVGEAIPFGSRVIRIGDFYDAVTHERGYQPALNREDALQLMIEQQLKREWADPNLFRIFIDMVKG